MLELNGVAEELSLSDDFLHDFQSFGLQWAGASSRKKPDAFFFGRAVDDFNLIICRGVIERIAGVLLKELDPVEDHDLPHRREVLHAAEIR
jgi:hypothetical protein